MNTRKKAEEYLKTKKLIMSPDMDGYLIPYSYLVTLLTGFTEPEKPTLPRRLIGAFKNRRR